RVADKKFAVQRYNFISMKGLHTSKLINGEPFNIAAKVVAYFSHIIHMVIVIQLGSKPIALNREHGKFLKAIKFFFGSFCSDFIQKSVEVVEVKISLTHDPN